MSILKVNLPLGKTIKTLAVANSPANGFYNKNFTPHFNFCHQSQRQKRLFRTIR
jgi:hypothetical protein